MGLPVLPDNTKQSPCAERAPNHTHWNPSGLHWETKKSPKDAQTREINPAMAVFRTEEEDLCLIIAPISRAKARLLPEPPPRLRTRGREENWMHMVQQDLDQGWLKLGMSRQSSCLLHVQIQPEAM